MQHKLRPYQVEGVNRLLELTASKPGAILADEPGLGKSAQVAEYINRTKPNTVLIVCPASLRINWRKELEMWCVHTPACGFCIVSYEGATKGTDTAFDLAVFDEAHYLKNPTAKRTKACLSIEAKTRLFLTGTPVVNRPMDLYPILASLGMKMNRVDYGKRYCNGHLITVRWKPRKKLAWDFTGASHVDELNEVLRRHVMVRRTKAEVLKELPAKIRQVIELDVPHGESVELQAAVSRMFRGLEEAAENVGELKRIAFTALARERLATAQHKLPYVVSFVKDLLEEEDKVVVFAYHREIIEALQMELPDAVKLYGGMTDRDKDYAVTTFQKGDARVFIGQITAAGTGLTLTAAKTVVFAEEDWVPGNLCQAEDRCHRIGQTEPVRVVHLTCVDSMDGRMIRAVVNKQEVIERLTK